MANAQAKRDEADVRLNVGLVRVVRDSLPDDLEWSERDLMLLGVAERQARDLGWLESGEIDGPPLGILRECRNQRIALGRLIGLVDIPAEPSTASVHARTAAMARWRRDGEAA
jgi:hypothetical protein